MIEFFSRKSNEHRPSLVYITIILRDERKKGLWACIENKYMLSQEVLISLVESTYKTGRRSRDVSRPHILRIALLASSCFFHFRFAPFTCREWWARRVITSFRRLWVHESTPTSPHPHALYTYIYNSPLYSFHPFYPHLSLLSDIPITRYSHFTFFLLYSYVANSLTGEEKKIIKLIYIFSNETALINNNKHAEQYSRWHHEWEYTWLEMQSKIIHISVDNYLKLMHLYSTICKDIYLTLSFSRYECVFRLLLWDNSLKWLMDLMHFIHKYSSKFIYYLYVHIHIIVRCL